MRVFRSVIEPLVLAMLNAGHHLSFGRAIAGKLVGDHDAGRSHLLLQQLAQQPLGRLLVASALVAQIQATPMRQVEGACPRTIIWSQVGLASGQPAAAADTKSPIAAIASRSFFAGFVPTSSLGINVRLITTSKLH